MEQKKTARKTRATSEKQQPLFVTPELVGGKDGQMIGNQIAYHLRKSLNWGLASAMGVILLSAILILYWVYDKIVGIDNMRLG